METLPKTETGPTAEQNTVTLPTNPPILNPLAQLVSHFEDDPFWDEMLDLIRQHRREMDAEFS